MKRRHRLDKTMLLQGLVRDGLTSTVEAGRRGVPDVLGYLRLSELPVPAHVSAAAETFCYNRRVFIAPPWPEIFGQDSERRQDLAEAERTYHAMVETYTELGYEIINLPRADVATRIEFVTKRITRGRAAEDTGAAR